MFHSSDIAGPLSNGVITHVRADDISRLRPNGPGGRRRRSLFAVSVPRGEASAWCLAKHNTAHAPQPFLLSRLRGICVGTMKIDKHDAEWKLSEGNETLGFVREFLGSFFVYRSGASHTQPQGPYRSMREAVNSLQRRAKRKRGLVYFKGALTRRREEDV